MYSLAKAVAPAVRSAVSIHIINDYALVILITYSLRGSCGVESCPEVRIPVFSENDWIEVMNEGEYKDALDPCFSNSI